jgi:hypothetical protein
MKGIVVLLLALVVCVPASLAADASVERGKKMSLAAVDLARSGSYAEAIVLFKKAYALTHDSMILYNIGQVAARMGDLPQAREYLERFLNEEREADALERGRQALKDVMARWPGWLRVTSPTVGALVEIDGKPAGRTPLDRPVELSPGEHTLKVIAPGKRAFERQVEVAAGEALAIAAILEDEPGVLSLKVEPSKAKVLVDGKAVDAALVSALSLAPGSHFLRVEAEGYDAEEQTIVAVGGETTRASVALKKKPAPQPVVAKAVAAPPVAKNDLSGVPTSVEKKGLSTLSWVLIGTGTAAVVAGGIVTGVLLANQGGGGATADGTFTMTKPLEVGR